MTAKFCWFYPDFNSSCSVFRILIILACFRLPPICSCLLMDFRIYPSSSNISLHFSKKLRKFLLIAATLPNPYWLVLEKLNAMIGLILGGSSTSLNLKEQSYERQRMFRSLVLVRNGFLFLYCCSRNYLVVG